VPGNDLQALYLEHGPEIRRYLARRISCADTAQELVHEIFLRLLRMRQVEPIDDPRAYLYRIAANLVADHFRRENGQRRADGADLLDGIADTAPGQERTVLARDEVRRLERAIDEMPPRRREIFLLHKFEGLSYGEIAERLGIAKNTVMVQMMRALAHCRDRLAEDD